MNIKVLTIFPNMFDALNYGVVGRAIKAQKGVAFETLDIRAFSADKHRRTDDYPFGGGAGMVMTPQPIVSCMEHATRHIAAQPEGYKALRVFMSPQGTPFSQRVAERLATYDELIFLCGQYEGVDQRAIDMCVDEEISLGDFVLTGGEHAAMCVIDAVLRLLPGVLHNSDSSLDESFNGDGLLEYPQYTHPREFMGVSVPDVLLSGDHAKINAWRKAKSIENTMKKRPDLLSR